MRGLVCCALGCRSGYGRAVASRQSGHDAESGAQRWVWESVSTKNEQAPPTGRACRLRTCVFRRKNAENWNGRGGIRTPEDVSQQIYSLPRLATPALAREHVPRRGFGGRGTGGKYTAAGTTRQLARPYDRAREGKVARPLRESGEIAAGRWTSKAAGGS